MLLARHVWATPLFGRLGLGAYEGKRGLSVLLKYQWCFNNLCYKSYRKMNCSSDWPNNSGENKKRKTIVPVSRPTSIQMSSAFCSMESNNGHPLETECLTSTSDNQSFIQQVEAVSDITEMQGLHPSTSDCCKQAEVSDERSVVSVSIEAETCLYEPMSIEIFDKKEFKETSGDSNFAANALLTPNNDMHSMSIEVGSLARFVKGNCGFTQRRIEEEFGVKITFPSSKKESSIFLEGVSSESVAGASKNINKILEEALKSVDYSHFISLPLAVHGELVEKVTEFQNSILGDASFIEDRNDYSDSDEDCIDNEDIKGLPEGADIVVKLDVQEKEQQIKVKSVTRSAKGNNSLQDLGIDKSIFLKPKQLHLTVLMLKLHRKDRVALAAEVLQKISSKVMDALGHLPISIRLKGLACMRGYPARAHVLYAPVEVVGGEERLLRACQVIMDAYLEAGLAFKEDVRQALKLHSTLMNTRQRRRSARKKRQKSDPFDARDIFRRFGAMEWGEYPLSEVHLSQRFIYDDNGYYHCCGSIPLPGSIPPQ